MAATPPQSLIIGAGLLGTATALRLAADGGAVRVLSRSIAGRLAETAAPAGIELVESEVGAPKALADAVEGVEAIICLAGSSTPAVAASDPVGAMLGSVHPALTALEAARRGGVRRVVIASSGGTVYGPDAPVPTPETAPLEPSSLHGANSLAVEAFADFYRRSHDLDVVVLRFSNAYGPGAESRGGQGVIAAWCRALALGHRPVLIGSAEVRRDFVFADDAAAAITAALGAPPGTYNVGGGSQTALGELLELLREVSGRDFELDARPARGVDVPGTWLDISRLREATGWEPQTGIKEGVETVWAWETRDL